MAFKRKYRKYRKSRRGKFSRRRGRRSLKTVIRRQIARSQETKFLDYGGENFQLYHDVGVLASAGCYGAVMGDGWTTILKGTGRDNRIGDQITPVGAKYRLWISNKLDRPNVMYRILLCSVKRVSAGVVTTTTNLNPMTSIVNNGMICPVDMEKVSRVYYDKIIKLNTPWGGVAPQKEFSRQIKIWLGRRRGGRPIKFDALGQIMNNPLFMYVIPYDTYGSLITDNIASMAYTARLYFKDS